MYFVRMFHVSESFFDRFFITYPFVPDVSKFLGTRTSTEISHRRIFSTTTNASTDQLERSEEGGGKCEHFLTFPPKEKHTTNKNTFQKGDLEAIHKRTSVFFL